MKNIIRLGLLLSLLLSQRLVYAQDPQVIRLGQAMTTAGDMIINNTRSQAARLPIGTTGQVLWVGSSGIPEWSSSLPAFSFAGNITMTGASPSLITRGNNTGRLTINGGSAEAGTTGALLQLHGASSTSGLAYLASSTQAGSKIQLDLGSSTSVLEILRQGFTFFTFSGANGNLTFDASNGGSIILPKAATGLVVGAASLDADITAVSGTPAFGSTTLNTSYGSVNVAIGANSTGASHGFLKTRSTTGDANTIVVSGDTIGSLNFFAADGIQYRAAAVIKAAVDTTPGSADMPGGLVFQTTPDGSATPANALYIDNAKAALFYGTVRSNATADIGWSVVNAVNQACNTTCTNACVVGIDTLGTGGFLGCAVATADSCICAGAS